MEDLFRSYWWLLFPLGAFVYGAWDRWLAYRRSRDTLDLIKSYAAQGKEPPAELVRRIEEDQDEEDWTGMGPSRRYRRRYYRRRYYRDDLRTAIFTGFLAGAFWVAAEYAWLPGTEGPFRLVALILTCIAVATLLAALLSSRFRDR
ncbi:MAG: hypothetical protein ACK41C_18280 [Phenylobacterium sp.]|jgi:hypothetical protein|uniref:hypothetical protein n=1 Tax=Phenylobacterium sp. TaxID=1871053 RepID=UPI00391C668C